MPQNIGADANVQPFFCFFIYLVFYLFMISKNGSTYVRLPNIRTVKRFVYVFIPKVHQERPYHVESTASRLLSEVKQRRAWLVLRWGTTLESQVLFFFIFSAAYANVQPFFFCFFIY